MDLCLASRRRLFAAAFVIFSFCFSQFVFAQKLPLEAFYSGPRVDDLSLSPNGEYVAALSNIGSDTALIVINVATGKMTPLIKTDNIQFKFNWIHWANNNRVVMSLRYDSRLPNGVKYQETRLFSIDAHKGGKPTQLLKGGERQDTPQFQDKVISWLPNDPDFILVSVDADIAGADSVYRVHVNRGRMGRIKAPMGSVNRWYADRQDNVRASYKYDDKEQRVTYRILNNTTGDWDTVWTYKVFEEPSIEIAGFGGNPNDLYIFADHEGRQALFKVDLAKPGYPRELVRAHDKYDVSGQLIYSEAHKDVVGMYLNVGEERSVFWHPEFKALQAGLDKAFPDTRNYIVGLDSSARRYLVYTSSETNPGVYYFGDRDKKTLALVGTVYPQFSEESIPKKVKHTYSARDGVKIEGFLSMPAGEHSKPLPTIILPHGGPMSHDTYGFDIFSTFLANRGYAVFQPNFRGSSGYGHDFMMQAIGGMGMAMQDDLVDGVDYLVKQKITDPKKICIVGASYGGYAALMGVSKTPDLFKCAVSFAGISDLEELSRLYRYFTNRNAARTQIGRDKNQLRDTSPVNLVEHIKAPILLIHGEDDVSVPVKHSRIMAKVLEKNGKTVEYIELEDGTHHLDYLPHRKQTFEAIEAFLAKHLPI